MQHLISFVLVFGPMILLFLIIVAQHRELEKFARAAASISKPYPDKSADELGVLIEKLRDCVDDLLGMEPSERRRDGEPEHYSPLFTDGRNNGINCAFTVPHSEYQYNKEPNCASYYTSDNPTSQMLSPEDVKDIKGRVPSSYEDWQ